METDDRRSLSPPHSCLHESDITLLNVALIDIKNTLSDMKDLLTSNAVLEEQALQFRKDIDALFSRIHKVEITTARHSGSSIWVERAVWAVVSMALGGMLALR